MASVSKRKWTHAGVAKETWVVRYNDGQKWRQKSFEKKKEADAYRQHVEREMFDGIHIAPGGTITFKALAESYMVDCQRRNRLGDKMTGNTLAWTRNWIDKHLVPHFGTLPAPEIKPQQVRDFVNQKAESYSRVSVGGMVKTMKRILQHGMDREVLRRNVVRDTPPRIPLPPQKRIEIPSLAQLQTLMEVLRRPREKRQRLVGQEMRRVIVYLALMAGLRRGEISALKWEMVDFRANLILVRHSLSRIDGLKVPKSQAGYRDVPMATELAGALIALREVSGDPTGGYVLRTRSGGPIETNDLSKRYWLPIAEAAGLRRSDGTLMGMHALRHAAASLWIKTGIPVLAVKKIIGHASVQVTMDVYGHLFPEDDSAQRAVSSTAAALFKPAQAPLIELPIQAVSVE